MRGVDVEMWTRANANWVDTDPRGRLHCAQTNDKWAKQIGPMGIVGPITGRDKGAS